MEPEKIKTSDNDGVMQGKYIPNNTFFSPLATGLPSVTDRTLKRCFETIGG